MPSQFSPPPLPLTPTSSSPAVSMSLAATARPVTEAHLLPPSELQASRAGMQPGPRQGRFSIADLLIPPLQPGQPHDQTYSVSLREPIPNLYSNVHDRTRSESFVSGSMNASCQPSTYSPITATTSGLHDMSLWQGQSHDNYFNDESAKSRMENWQSDTRKASSQPDIQSELFHERSVSRSTPQQSSEKKQPESVSGLDLLLEASRPPMENKISRNFKYELVVRQQPIAARACGFGERDRRTIDPPPILEMIICDPDASKSKVPSTAGYPPDSVVHCELWNADMDIAEAHLPEIGERRQQRRLMGTLVASPFFGKDESDVKSCFFPFPDLSCRTTGKYRLKFTLVLIDPSNIKPGDKLPIEAMVLSDVFEVYTAKTFPGMIESTNLTKRLKAQGCLITVKKGHQRHERKRATLSVAEDDHFNSDDDNGENNDLEHGQDKRQKV